MLPRRFALVRHVDYTGISGVGVVAYGVVFADGHVALRWPSEHPATSLWNSIDDLMAVHGHGEATSVEWLDPQTDLLARPLTDRTRGRRARRVARAAAETTEGTVTETIGDTGTTSDTEPADHIADETDDDAVDEGPAVFDEDGGAEQALAAEEDDPPSEDDTPTEEGLVDEAPPAPPPATPPPPAPASSDEPAPDPYTGHRRHAQASVDQLFSPGQEARVPPQRRTGRHRRSVVAEDWRPTQPIESDRP